MIVTNLAMGTALRYKTPTGDTVADSDESTSVPLHGLRLAIPALRIGGVAISFDSAASNSALSTSRFLTASLGSFVFRIPLLTSYLSSSTVSTPLAFELASAWRDWRVVPHH